jgi:hypothetical protein
VTAQAKLFMSRCRLRSPSKCLVSIPSDQRQHPRVVASPGSAARSTAPGRHRSAARSRPGQAWFRSRIAQLSWHREVTAGEVRSTMPPPGRRASARTGCGPDPCAGRALPVARRARHHSAGASTRQSVHRGRGGPRQGPVRPGHRGKLVRGPAVRGPAVRSASRRLPAHDDLRPDHRERARLSSAGATGPAGQP